MTSALSNETVMDRLKRRFDRWDSDRSGTLERSDFEREVNAIAKGLGHGPKAPQTKRLRDAMAGIYESMARDGGVSTSGPIPWDQFYSAAEVWMENPDETLHTKLRPLVDAIIGMADNSADGRIGRDEFIGWITAIGTDRSKAERAFDALDTNRSGDLGADEVLDAVVDYHLGRTDFDLL
jgi:Ca2+-binding EF-hand superfamily protein